MTWTTLYGFLTLTFVAHLVVFAILYARSRNRTHLLLCGTFICLTVLFALKFVEFDWALGFITVQVLLRAIAGGCTLLALYLGLKRLRREAAAEAPILSPRERRDRRKRRRRRGRSRRDDDE